MGSHPTHQDVITSLTNLCSDSIVAFEAGLKAQVNADTAAREAMERAQEKARLADIAAKEAANEAARLALEHAKKKASADAMARDHSPITFKTAARAGSQDVGDDDSEDEEDGNDSVGEEVRIEFHLPALFYTHNTS